MYPTISKEVEAELVRLFRLDKTVREIAEIARIDAQQVLFYLTKLGLWSTYCSDCVLKRCYDCRGLSELGKPLSVQDEVDLLALLKKSGAQDDRERPREAS